MAGKSFLSRLLPLRSGGPEIRLSHALCTELTAGMSRADRIEVRIQAVEAILPFWMRAIEVCGELTGQEALKTVLLVSKAESLPGWCRKWQGGTPIEKARVREVWKPTSFVWNAALRDEMQGLAVAPVIRNMHAVVTGLIQPASDPRNKVHLFGLAYHMALLRQQFPFDASDLLYFSRQAKLNGIDEREHAPLAYAAAARALKNVDAMQAVFDDALVVAENFGTLETLDADAFDWEAEGASEWQKIRNTIKKSQATR